jgi:hypothetical protein
VAKVTINGEVFGWDPSRKPMSEALAIEHALKCNYAQWETDLQAGSARAICGFIWLVWRRDGRDVALDDILSGEVEIDLGDFNVEADEGETDPTTTAPAALNGTGGATSASSPRSSTSARGRSGSSSRTSSKP